MSDQAWAPVASQYAGIDPEIARRALNALYDFLGVERQAYETRTHQDRTRPKRGPRHGPLEEKDNEVSRAVQSWERRRITLWSKRGRLTDDGTLRLRHRRDILTHKRIKRVFKHLHYDEVRSVLNHLGYP